VNVYDAKGTQVARVGISGGESPIVQIQLADAQGKVRYRAALDPDGNPRIQLYDADGTVTWTAP